METNKTVNFIWPYAEPPLFESYWFENFNVSSCTAWMEKNWTISLYISAAYLTFIKVGSDIMRSRKPFDLRRPLALWNLGFAVFSFAGLVRCTPELWYVLKGENGFHRSVCVRDSHSQPAAFWAWAFVLSKVAELGDTVILVLRKKDVLFVHYYHHCAALIMCWYFYADYEPIFRYWGVCNYFVHSLLYGYLFLKAINLKMPAIFSKILIMLEILQMIVSVIANAYSVWVKVKGESCEHRTEGIILQTLVCLSFAVLFYYLSKTSRTNRTTLKDKSQKKVN